MYSVRALAGASLCGRTLYCIALSPLGMYRDSSIIARVSSASSIPSWASKSGTKKDLPSPIGCRFTRGLPLKDMPGDVFSVLSFLALGLLENRNESEVTVSVATRQTRCTAVPERNEDSVCSLEMHCRKQASQHLCSRDHARCKATLPVAERTRHPKTL